MAVKVDDSNYQRTYDKKPSGFGNWAFWLGKETDDITKAMWFSGQFNEAVKQAKEHAKKEGHYLITVGS